MSTLPLPARLLRGFAVNFLTAHAKTEVERIMHPAYRLSISGIVLDGRDAAYLPATAAQLDLFPGLCVTVHDTLFAPGAAAMRFTEHGIYAREGRGSSWGGITLFRIEDGRFAEGWAEEDYFARKRQLRAGTVDAIRAPHAAPWDEPMRDPDPVTERIVRDWIADPATFLASATDIAANGPRLHELIAPEALRVSALFTAGSRAALHAVLEGRYVGGFGDPAHAGIWITMPVAALIDVIDAQVARAQVSADRLGLQRQLSHG